MGSPRTPSIFKPDSNVEGVSAQDVMSNAIESRHIAINEIENKHISDVAVEVENLNLQQGKILKIGDGSNYSEFEADGTLKMNGNATTWIDIDFPIIIRVVAANLPVLTTVKGNLSMPLWQVDDYYQFESQEIIHSYKEGSTGNFHIHIITNGTDIDDRYIKFQLEYNYANKDSAWKTNNIIVDSPELLIPANTPANTHIAFSIINLVDENLKIMAHVKPRLTRVAATGTAPTNHPFCEMMQLHIEQDTIGSRQIITK